MPKYKVVFKNENLNKTVEYHGEYKDNIEALSDAEQRLREDENIPDDVLLFDWNRYIYEI